MSLSVYWLFLLIIDGLLLFLGLHLIFGTIPSELKINSYLSARKSMGRAIMVAPIAGFVYYFAQYNRDVEMYEATAVNLTTHFLTALLIVMSFTSLVSYKLNRQKRRYVITLSAFILYLVPVWLPIIIGVDSDTMLICHIVAAVMLAAFVIACLIYMYVAYKRILNHIDNYYSSDAVSHVTWVMKSIYMFVGLGVIACVSPFSNHYPLELNFVYLLYQTAVYVYVYESFCRFETATMLGAYQVGMINTSSEVHQIPSQEPLSEEIIAYIEKELQQWIKKRKYIKQGITINSVAADIFTNRTYLSIYINNICKCTFKSWITHLRIDESKKLLCDNEKYTSVQIAEKVGFPNADSFTRQFKKLEGVSPTIWRDTHKRSLFKAS